MDEIIEIQTVNFVHDTNQILKILPKFQSVILPAYVLIGYENSLDHQVSINNINLENKLPIANSNLVLYLNEKSIQFQFDKLKEYASIASKNENSFFDIDRYRQLKRFSSRQLLRNNLEAWLVAKNYYDGSCIMFSENEGLYQNLIDNIIDQDASAEQRFNELEQVVKDIVCDGS